MKLKTFGCPDFVGNPADLSNQSFVWRLVPPIVGHGYMDRFPVFDTHRTTFRGNLEYRVHLDLQYPPED